MPGVSERVRCEFRPNARVDVLPLADRYHIPHPVARLDDPEAELHVREHADAPAVTRAALGLALPATRGVGSRSTAASSPAASTTATTAREDPPVVGLGFTAVRDTASFLRWGTAAEGNPCAGAIERSYVFGVSQSGRFLRHLLYLGLDEDEAGRFVWDAVIPHVAGARRGEFNCRFGQPSLNAVHAVGSLFPFTDGEQDDPVTGQRDALLRRLAGRAKPPRIFTINTSAEYWRGDGSLVHTDVGGTRDVTPPAYVRQYLFAGSQHTPGALPPPAADPNTGGRGFHPFSVVDYSPLLRAALVQPRPLGDRGRRAAAERGPAPGRRHRGGRRGDRAASTRRFPARAFPISSSGRSGSTSGPTVERGIVATLPPKQGAPYVTFVSAVDADGNERAGIRPPELRVPLATFMGWNPRHPEQGAPGDIMSMMGSTLAFARTAAERARTGDPRLSIEERYAGREALSRAGAPGRRARWSRPGSSSPRTWTRWWRARARSGTSSVRAELALATSLIECHAHVLPDGALARFPDGGDPRYVTAERRVLGRMLEAHDACGVTHALVSDSFYMESAAARELGRMVGVSPSAAPSGGRRYLDDPACGPLLAAAEALGRPLFHPSRDLPAGEHYDDFVMSLIIGRPSQTAVELPPADRDAVRWRNATRLFGLEPARVGA